MYDAYPGKLALTDGRLVSAVFTIGEDVLTISAEGITVGTWPLKYCRVAPDTADAFRVVVDGEPTVFRPADPVEFARVAAQRFRASPLSDRINVMRGMPPAVAAEPLVEAPEPKSPLLDIPKLPMIGGISMVAILILIAVAGFNGVETAPADVTAVPATTVETAAVPPSIDAAPEVFTLTAAAFADRWNETADKLDSPVLVQTPETEPGDAQAELAVTEVVTLSMRLDDDGTVAGYTVTVDATRLDDSTMADAFGALGVAIGMADPGSGPGDWAILLDRLGLRATADITAIKKMAELDGVSFYLWYAEPVSALLLEVAPL